MFRVRAASCAAAPRGPLAAGLPGALLHALYVSCFACALALACLADVPHLSIEARSASWHGDTLPGLCRAAMLTRPHARAQRKLVTVCVVPSSLLFFSQARARTLGPSLAVLCLNWALCGFVAHLLLRRGAAAPAPHAP